MDLVEILSSFACESLFDASGKLLKHLGVKCSTQTEEPIPFLELYEDAAKDAEAEVPKPIKKIFGRVDKTYFIGTVDDDTLAGKNDEVSFAAVAAKPKYEGMFVFAVQMKEGETLTRTEASLITRGINRIVKQMPATVIILEDSLLSIATCERTEYRQSWRPGEKLGRVSILKGINCLNPHRGHLDILESMNVKKAKTFDALYTQWKDVFSSKLLTKQFYREIQNWYFWALKSDQHVAFPNALDDDSDDEKFNSENMIRLITRLIFTWFMKEKHLVNPDLFNPEFLSAALKHFNAEGVISDPKDRDADKSCTYYRAVLQNLFFATFNQEIKMRDFVETQVRDSKRYNIKNYYRNAKLFTETDKQKIIGYFNGSPFVNGGLFECLDNVEQNGHVYSWDGFSNNVRYQNGSLKSALIPDRLFFGGETTTDLSEFFEKDKSAKCVKVRGIINILNDYVFTIEENTPLDEDVALDPELLGKVFENLLGCYNPETQQMARNSTGSFYTPREIVNYMVRVSLKAYLKRKCPKIAEAELDALVSGTAELEEMPSVKANAKDILTALFKAKILDPACGSGAFPMGIMLAVVDILRKVDPDNRHWYEIVLKESLAEAESVAEVGDEQERADLKAQIEYDFKERMDHPDYARKLYVIEHCIFGGDIQPIAVQISRLRFFITLLCEQTRTDDPATNYGITPLPNLENNFVAANSLLSIDLKDMRELLGQKKIVQLVKQLRAVRHQLFLPKTSDKKKHLQRRDEELRAAIAAAAEGLYDENVAEKLKLLEGEIVRADAELAKLSPDDFKDVVRDVEEIDLFGNKTVTQKKVVGKGNELKKRRDAAASEVANLKNSSRKERLLTDLKRLVAWNPFAFNVAESFLDPEWMFGVKDGFDIVIGNPPYIQLQSNHGELGNVYKDCGFKTFVRTGDIYSLFYERGWGLLNADGCLCYITSNKWMRAGYGEETRRFFAENTNPLLLIDFAGEKIFESATVDTNILLFGKEKNEGKTMACIGGPDCRNDLSDFVKQNSSPSSFTASDAWIILSPIEQSIKRKIESVGTPLKDWDIQINYGIKTGCNEAFIISTEKRNQILAQCATKEERERTDALIRPILRGRDIKRFGYEWANLWIIATFPSRQYDIEQFPAVKDYLLSFGIERLEQTGVTHIVNGVAVKARKKTNNKWFETQDSISYWDDFSKPKIVWADLARTGNAFIYDTNGFTAPNTTYLIASNDTVRLKYLVGVLNSRTILKYLDWISAKLDETGWRWFKQYVETFPIPRGKINEQSKIATLVDEVLSAKANHCESKVLEIEQEIDICVFNLYNFSEEEINSIVR